MNKTKYEVQKEYLDGLAAVKKIKWGFIDENNIEIIDLKYEEVRGFSNGLAAVKSEKKWGYINKIGHVNIPYLYDKADDFNEGVAAVMKKIDLDIEYLYEENSDDTNSNSSINSWHLDAYMAYLEGEDSLNYEKFNEYKIKLTEKWGVIDTENKIIVPFYFESISSFKNGCAFVCKDGNFGLINKLGVAITECKYSYYSFCKENNLYLVSIGNVDTDKNNWGFIDNDGNEVLSCSHNYNICIYHEDKARIYIEELGWGFIDTNAKIIISCQYESVNSFSQGLAAAKKNNKWGFVNTSNQIVIPFEYDECFWFYDGLSVVKNADKYGFINLLGEVVTPIEYDKVGNFKEGYCEVSKDGKMGFIDKKGDLKISTKYKFNYQSNFENGIAKVNYSRKRYEFLR